LKLQLVRVVHVDGTRLSLNCGHQKAIPKMTHDYGKPRLNDIYKGKPKNSEKKIENYFRGISDN
jgi:hypothetical protein